MSKLETPLILEYWQRVGGTLMEEFQVVRRSRTCGQRLVDAIVLPRGEHRRLPRSEYTAALLEGQEVIVVQAKADRLGMYLMGQALFSAELVRQLGAASVRSIAFCTAGDSALEPLLAAYPQVEVVVIDRASIGTSHALTSASFPSGR